MSSSRRKYLTTSDISKMTGWSQRHVARSRCFKNWHIGNPSLTKHHRYVLDAEIVEVCRGIREARREQPGAGLRPAFKHYKSARTLEEKACALAEIRLMQEIAQQAGELLQEQPRLNNRKLKSKVEEMCRAWFGMIDAGYAAETITEVAEGLQRDADRLENDSRSKWKDLS